MNVGVVNNLKYVSNSAFKQNPQNHTNAIEKNTKNASPQNVLVDKNYGILQTKKMNVSFKGGGLPAPVKTLGDKVNNLFNVIQGNDLIVASSSLKKAVKDVDKNINSFRTVIKRMFVIEDKSLQGTVGFRRNLKDKEVVNLSDNLIFIRDNKNQTGYLKPGESGYLLDTDTVLAGGKEIPIQEREDTFLPVSSSFNHFVDLTESANQSIKKVNRTSIQKIEEVTSPNTTKKITFKDVGGQDNAIKELKENILYPIKYPEIKNGKNMRKSAILSGPPGTGKSLLAEATANESGAWFKKINASELDSKYVGESEANWRALFDEARENQPSIIFIDEIDAIAKKRGGQDVYGDKTLNTILGLMSDSEKKGDEIYLLAATNNKSLLDTAVTRSGRFGIDIHVGPPSDVEGTAQILDIHTKNEPLAKDFDKKAVAQKIFNQKATGADIASISEDARRNAISREKIFEKIESGTYQPEDMAKLEIKNEDFDKAIDSFAQKQENNKPKARIPIGFTSPLYRK